MRIIYVTAQLSAPPNQLTAHNIKVSSFVTIGQTQLHQLTSADDDGTSLFLLPLLSTTKTKTTTFPHRQYTYKDSNDSFPAMIFYCETVDPVSREKD
jgi:hypothetical protein